MFDSVTSELER